MGSEKITIVGGGLIGAAIAYGAAKSGLQVRVLDQGDVAFRASRGNFGLVWVQSKGEYSPQYARWTRDAAQLWPAFHRDLLDVTGIDTGLQQTGGFWLGFTEKQVEDQAALLARIDREAGGIPFKMMEPAELKEYLPGLGPKVVGGSYCPLDGHANPLLLLRALHTALKQFGADIVTGIDVADIRYDSAVGQFEAIASDGQRWKSDRLVLAAGIGNARLAPQLGLLAPVETTRGQLLITERLKPFLHYPMNGLRQTNEGTVQIGSSTEDVGLDDRTTPDQIRAIAQRAVDKFPALARARMVRAWGALRVLTPDGYPIYDASTTCPGAYVATSHSGVTLAAAHSSVIAPWMCGLAQASLDLDVFKGDRFADPNKRFIREH
jgi:glycine/D-amino acid oxidase-like deaminating enzyme